MFVMSFKLRLYDKSMCCSLAGVIFLFQLSALQFNKLIQSYPHF